MISDRKPILSLETATPVCSVALRLPDGTVREMRDEGKGVHSELTFVFIDHLLRQERLEVTDLGAVIVSAGPGSFTGLRVASSAVKGLLFGTPVALYACHTLGAFALGARGWVREQVNRASDSGQRGSIFSGCEAVIDARRNHLYHQSWKFSKTGVEPVSEVTVRELEEVLEIWKSGRLLAGTGAERLMQLEGVDIPPDLPVLPVTAVVDAAHILQIISSLSKKNAELLIKKVAPEHFEPYYYSGPWNT